MVGGLLQGSNITLKPVTDVCIGRMMSNALNLFNDLEQAVRALAAGDKAKVADINLLSPAGQLAMTEPSLALERFYEGQSETCEEFALSVDEWMLLMTETTRLGGLAQSFARAFARWERMQTTAEQESFEAQRGELTSSLERLMLGSDQPPLPVQPSQELFRRMAEVVQPAVAALRGATSLAEAISRMGALEDVMKALLQTYADEVLKQEPSFPAQRVQVAMWQSVLAQTAYKEALLATYKLTGTSDMQSTMNQFETAQIQLKDGGGPVPRAIMLERRDLLTQWEAVQLSWARFKGVLIQGSSQLDMEAALQARKKLLWTSFDPLHRWCSKNRRFFKSKRRLFVRTSVRDMVAWRGSDSAERLVALSSRPKFRGSNPGFVGRLGCGSCFVCHS
ncbi:unnamed protein product [Effrenium voratum]|uniref:Uncharacterized protein n=1 Tax=Effrenium voratum TaxID=2562239 RepID=A0AA36NH08_9DINO|nr:unnamed protein product [Effrenium voratum]